MSRKSRKKRRPERSRRVNQIRRIAKHPDLELLEDRQLLAFNVIDADPDNLIIQADALLADDLVLEDHVDPGYMTLRSADSSSTHTFPNPSVSLTIELGDGVVGLLGTGDDQLLLTSFDAAFSASVLVDGGLGSDQVFITNDIHRPGADVAIAAQSASLHVNDGLTISTRDVAGTDLLADPSTGDSGDIQLLAPEILLGNNVHLLSHALASDPHAAGNIQLLATAETITPNIQLGVGSQAASITLGNSVVVRGADVEVSSTAADLNTADDAGNGGRGLDDWCSGHDYR